MNISLSPNDTLGRLLHTFTATAYEIAENNFNSIQSFGLIDNHSVDNRVLAWETIDIHKRLYEEGRTDNNLLNYKAVSLRLEGLLPGDKLILNDERTIVIGATGAYNLELDAGIEIASITFVPQNDNITIRHQGTLTYAYYRTTMNKFDTIKDISIIDVPVKQMQGPCYNLIAQFDDIKYQLQKIHFIHAKQIDFNNTNLNDNLLTINGNPISLIEIKEYDMKNVDTFDITFGSNIQLEICYQINEIIYDIEPSLSEYIDYHRELDKLNNAIYHETTSTPPAYIINQQKLVQEKYNDFIKALETKLREQEAIEGETV